MSPIEKYSARPPTLRQTRRRDRRGLSSGRPTPIRQDRISARSPGSNHPQSHGGAWCPGPWTTPVAVLLGIRSIPGPPGNLCIGNGRC